MTLLMVLLSLFKMPEEVTGNYDELSMLGLKANIACIDAVLQ